MNNVYKRRNKQLLIPSQLYRRARMEMERLEEDSLVLANTNIDSYSELSSTSVFVPDHELGSENKYDSDATGSESSSNELHDLDSEIELNIPTEAEDLVETSHANDINFGLQLGEWAIQHNINHLALTSLLHILKPMVHKELPLDSRTLMKTRRELEIISIEPGHYYHFGFEKVIRKIINSDMNENVKSNLIELCINIDGLPLAKSSGSQCYPILCKLFNVNNVHIIGLYHGNDKPKSANNFLKLFVNEANDTLCNGVFHNGHHYSVKIKAFICDVPAKSFVKYTKGHGGYYSCTKCTTEGVFINNRICFPDTSNLNLRSDLDFRNKTDEEHHTGRSILENLSGLDMIKDFPVEYMHLVCLGVVKKLIVNLWIDGKPGKKLSAHQISNISDSLLMCKSQIPVEFNRKARSLAEVKRWKATEFRTFLFYLGPVVLQPVLNHDKYINFLTLHVAMTILASKVLTNQIYYARALLKYFVETFIIIYGQEYVSHNIHNLLHLCDDVEHFGTLDMFSAFSFENHMQAIKKLVRKGDKPLQQICRRLLEQENIRINSLTSNQLKHFEMCIEHSEGPLIDVKTNK